MDKSKISVEAKLREIGFFEYNESDDVINEVFQGYEQDGIINFPNGLNRVFGIDAEDIYEEGGLLSNVESWRDNHLFDKMGIKLNIGNYTEEFDNSIETYTKREIQINGKTYATPNVNGWDAAFFSGIDIVTQLLKENNLNMAVYGLLMDMQAASLIILNEQQFKYLVELIPEDHYERPVNLANFMNNPNVENTAIEQADVKKSDRKWWKFW
jgi:hypothetical protein